MSLDLPSGNQTGLVKIQLVRWFSHSADLVRGFPSHGWPIFHGSSQKKYSIKYPMISWIHMFGPFSHGVHFFPIRGLSLRLYRIPERCSFRRSDPCPMGAWGKHFQWENHGISWKKHGNSMGKSSVNVGNGPLPRLITRGYGLALMFFLVLRLVFLLGRSLMQIQRLFFKTAISDWRPTWAQIWWSSKLITDCQRQRMVPFPSDTGSSWAVASGRHVCSKT